MFISACRNADNEHGQTYLLQQLQLQLCFDGANSCIYFSTVRVHNLYFFGMFQVAVLRVQYYLCVIVTYRCFRSDVNVSALLL